MKQTEADCKGNCKNRFLFHLDSSQLVDYWQVFTQGFNAETLHTHTHTLPPLPLHDVCVLGVYVVCVRGVCVPVFLNVKSD